MIRDASPDDYHVLRALQGALQEPSPQLLDAAIRSDVGTVLVSVDDDLPLGYVLAVPGEPGWIAELVVAPDARRTGQGTKLLVAACSRLDERGCERVELAVDPDNEPAVSLYRSLGFRRVRTEPAFYGTDPALILGRDL